MANLRFTNIPERGDVVLGELSTKRLLFLKEDTFDSIVDIDQTKYEVLGVVYNRDRNEVKFVYQENAAKVWCERIAFKLTGYTLDGTERSGVLTIRTASDWAMGVDYTITYQATTMAELVTQLNSYFSANEPFVTQDWIAEIVDNEYVNLHFATANANQVYNTGKSGFTLTANILTEIPYNGLMLRKNGYYAGQGCIYSMTKALHHFHGDLSSSSYNPTSNVTTVKIVFPICLPAYLGQSIYRKDGDTQLDYCSYLRSIYGEGEIGWRRFMESILPVYPTDFGVMEWGVDRAMEYTRIMADKRYTSQKKTNEPMCKAAYYCDSITRQTLPDHSYRMATTQELSELFDGVQYAVINNRNADILNKTLYKLGGTAVICSASAWAAFRSNNNNTWYLNASVGFFYFGFFGGNAYIHPVSTYILHNE